VLGMGGLLGSSAVNAFFFVLERVQSTGRSQVFFFLFWVDDRFESARFVLLECNLIAAGGGDRR
jgi:hypothetical protein